MNARELAISLQLMSQGLRVMTGYWIDEAEKLIEAHDAEVRASAKMAPMEVLKEIEARVREECVDKAVAWLLIDEKPDGSYITQLRAAILGKNDAT